MKDLTKREKVLIYAMILTIILGGGMFIFRSMYANCNKATEKRDTLQMQQALLMQTAADNSDAKNQLLEVQKFCEKNQKAFLAATTNDYLEQNISRELRKRNLSIQTITINSDADTSSNGQSTTEASADTGSKKKKNSAIVSAQVNLTVKGSYKNFCNFLNDCAGNVSYRVSQYSLYSSKNVNYSVNNSKTYTIYVDLNCNMLDLTKVPAE